MKSIQNRLAARHREFQRQAILSVLVFSLCAVTAGCRHMAAGKAPVPALRSSADDAYGQIDKLAEVMLLVRKYYVEDRSYTNIISGALSGMLEALDEHSHYMDGERVKELQEDTSGRYGGVGILIGVREGLLTVIAPIEDTPAYRAGIMSRDVIIKIDDQDTVGISEQDAVKRMRGEPGTPVVLTIRRKTELQPRTFDLVREKININNVKGDRMVRPGIGYARITQFAEPTAVALQKALDRLRGEGMQALILDLRDNPGGLLKSGKEVAEEFLKKGVLVVSIRDRAGKDSEKKLLAEGVNHDVEMPMAILINGGTASASEIVAGALQDHRRAILIGEKSFGKGSVQTVIPLSTDPDTAIRLTTAKYYTPSEREIHKHGIEPDIAVPVTPEQWGEVVRRRAHIEEPEGFTSEEKQKYLTVVDQALERAADVLQAMITLKGRMPKQSANAGALTNAGAAREPEPEVEDER